MSTTTAQRHDLWTLTILSLLMAFASISTDIYLPAMPIMGAALHTATCGVELTISGYLVGMLSNGTPWPLGASMAFFGLGCTLCAVLLTPSH
jgi:DHA1 family bicyclomycin/chloramphenicol resistance-like MFS transporter